MPDIKLVAKGLDELESTISYSKKDNFPYNNLIGFGEVSNSFLSFTLTALFPCFGSGKGDTNSAILSLDHEFSKLLTQRQDSQQLRKKLIDYLPELKRLLIEDANAIWNGDPAAKSLEEIILCYPGFYALCLHRTAHHLEKLDCGLLARYISESAHQRTGIDIHPGASIGERFCIDHGTGVVIGETTVIGKDVKVYHGVTLGGLSVLKSQASKKRHPTIEDNVIIYSNAVILGGATVIGRNSIIGGNVWLTESVPENSLVEIEKPRLSIKVRKNI